MNRAEDIAERRARLYDAAKASASQARREAIDGFFAGLAQRALSGAGRVMAMFAALRWALTRPQAR